MRGARLSLALPPFKDRFLTKESAALSSNWELKVADL
jgi:hypothetical protein